MWVISADILESHILPFYLFIFHALDWSSSSLRWLRGRGRGRLSCAPSASFSSVAGPPQFGGPGGSPETDWFREHSTIASWPGYSAPMAAVATARRALAEAWRPALGLSWLAGSLLSLKVTFSIVPVGQRDSGKVSFTLRWLCDN